MQLRKRSSNVNYTDGGSPPTSRPRRGNYATLDATDNSGSEDGGSSDETQDGSSRPENSDDEELRSAKKKPPLGSKRKHSVVVYKRNAWNSRRSASQSSHDEGVDDENDFVAVKTKAKKRKILAEPRSRPLRSRRSETVNYKDASSSDEGSKQGDHGSAERNGKVSRKNMPEDSNRNSSESSADDEELLDSSKSSYRKKGASNGKMRRVAAPSVESTDSHDKDRVDGAVKCYARRSKNSDAVVSDDENDQIAAPSEKDLSTSPGASTPNRISSELDSKVKHSTGVRRAPNEASDATGDQLNKSALTSNILREERPSKSPSFAVDTFGLRIGENDYGPITNITKRMSKVEKVLAVRNRSTGEPVFCVKLQGRSYRNVVNVVESELQKHYPQLLRNFTHRLHHVMNRTEGHPGDHEKSPAFRAEYLKIDRIVAMERSGRKAQYLVKWRGLPYSEATWERESDLLNDAAELDRYDFFNRKKKRGRPAGSSSKLVFKDGRTLRDYQEEGVSWLHDKYENGVNCILADEMGLGKTIQSVALLETLRLKHSIRGPFLVVAPVSTLGHWQREVETLTDMNCVVYSGTQEDRETIREYEFNYDGDPKSAEVKFNVLLTSFEMVMKDQSKLAKIKWQFIIVDEAHRLKSRDSKTSLSLKHVTVGEGGLLLLTGTPVQNNTKEIFSLLNLLDAENFGSEEEFLTKYGDLKNGDQVKDLQDNVLRPRLLRRMKEDVEKTIPQKEETIVWVELTRQQRVYYRAIFENNMSTLLKGSGGQNLPRLRNVAMELRKVCNHPLLCNGVENDLILKQSGSKPGGKVDREFLQHSSGKMVLVDKLLPMLKEAGRRILIFSQFTMMLDLLEEYLVDKGYTFERIDGNTKSSDRQAAIDRYSAKDSDGFVFLLSTRAGGLGITLTAADTCLIYDSDWNPQNDLQAMARCHRIGQTKDVKIYRLITRNTYEQKLFETSSRKYGLDEAILGNRLGADGDMEQSFNIESLLKNGAYDMMKDDGEASAAEFSAQNIHEILEQRTQKRLIGGRGVNTFSVATFVSQPGMETEPVEEGKELLKKRATEFWHELLPEACKRAEAEETKVSQSPPGPRKKRAKMRVDYREDPKSTSDDETYENTGGSGRESHTEESSESVESEDDDVVVSWSDREVKRLEDRLTALGRNRARQIQEEAKLEHRDVSQVEQVSDYIIQLCHFEVNKASEVSVVPQKSPDVNASNQKPDIEKPTAGDGIDVKGVEAESVPALLPPGCVLVNDLESGVNYRKDGVGLLIGDNRRPAPPACLRNVVKSRIFADRIARNATRYLQVLHERAILALAIAENDPNLLPGKVPGRSKKIPSWWGPQEDRDLLIGIHKHGHREFKKIRMDSSLCFSKRTSVTSPSAVQIANGQEVRQWAGINVVGTYPNRNIEVPSPCSINTAGQPSLNTEVSLHCGINAGLDPNLNTDLPPRYGMNTLAYPNPNTEEGIQFGDWPSDVVLAGRIKKLLQLLSNGSATRDASKRLIMPDRKRTADASGNAEKSRPVAMGAVLKEKSCVIAQKLEVSAELTHCSPTSAIAGKENEDLTTNPLLINSDKKDVSPETIRQQRITGYFNSKVVAAT